MFSKRSLWLLLLVALSMTAFGRSRGFYEPASLLIYVLVAAGVCFVLLRLRRLDRHTKSQYPGWLLYGAVLVNVAYQSQRTGLLYPSNLPLLAAARVMGYTLVALVVLQFPPLFHRVSRRGRGVICGVCAATAAAMLLMVPLISPDPAIDVVTVQKEAAEALRAGENPYQKAEYNNIYAPETPWYPDGRMNSYPYPPLTMLAALIGDPRWLPTCGHLFGALTVFLIGRKRLPLPESFWLSLLVLYPPNAMFVVEQGWTDPNLVLGLSLVALSYRSGRMVPSLLAFGLLFAFKQSMIILVPLVWMLWPTLKLRTYLWAAVIPVVTYLPFVLWAWPAGAQAMYADLVTFHARTPFRPEALTLSALCFRMTGRAFPSALSAVGLAGFGLGFLTLVRRIPPRPLFRQDRFLVFLLTFGFVFLSTLLFSKHAFTNYFYLFHFVLVLALAWSRIEDVRPVMESR
jgi:hypothetical protein